MSNAFAGGIQKTVNIEYSWQDRLIEWLQNDPLQAGIAIVIAAVAICLAWRFKRN